MATNNIKVMDPFSDMFMSSCDVITNPVNSVGIMGGGLAAQFMARYPNICDHFNSYSNGYQMNFRVNKLMVPMYYEAKFSFNDRAVLMFPTKLHWRNPSEYKFISDGLDQTKSILAKHGNPSIAFPALGCGLGGLNFEKVLDMINRILYDYPNQIEVYRP